MDEPTTEPTGRAKGGKARAAALAPGQRSEIARQAAITRWAGAKGLEDQSIVETDRVGVIHIGATDVPCAVIRDGIRVVSERGLVKAFGGKRGGSHWRRMKQDQDGATANLPIILSAHNLRRHIDEDLYHLLQERFIYRIKGSGAKPAYGLKAQLFPKICEVFLRARDAGDLDQSQREMATSADILMRGLAHVGIIALVDEATGYQEVRDRIALRAILEQFIGKELVKWERRFPPEFYRTVFRLKGWTYDSTSTRRPIMMAQITNDLIYRRLAPGVLTELQRKSPKDENGRRKNKLYGWLTLDVGHPALDKLFDTVLVLGTANDDWDTFMRGMDRVAPRYGETMPLNYGEFFEIPNASEQLS